MSNEIKKKVVYVAGKMRGVPYYNFPAFDKARDRLADLGFEVLSPADMDRAAGFDPTIWSSIMLLAITASSWSKTPSSFDLAAAIKRNNEAIDRADAIYVIHEGIAESAGGMAEIERGMKAGKIVLFDTMSDERILRAMGLHSKESLKRFREVIEKLCEPLHSQMAGCVQVEPVKPSPGGAWETITDAPENPPYTLRAKGVIGVPEGYGIFGKRTEPSSAAETRYTAREGVLDEAKKLITGDCNASYGPPTQDFQRTADMMTALFSAKLREGVRFKASDVAWIITLVKASRAQHSPKRDNYVDAAGYMGCGWECEANEPVNEKYAKGESK